MKKELTMFSLIIGLAAGTTACTQTEKQAANYGVGGAALGAITGGVLGGSGGAFTGAVAGGAAGTVIGSTLARNDSSNRLCTYRDSKNRTFQAACHP